MAVRDSESRDNVERIHLAGVAVSILVACSIVQGWGGLTQVSAQARLLGSPVGDASATRSVPSTPDSDEFGQADAAGSRGSGPSGSTEPGSSAADASSSAGAGDTGTVDPGLAVPPPPGASSRYRSSRGPRLLEQESGLRISSGVATRLRALDSDFQVLAARGGGSIVDGVISILSGGLSITVGILIEDYGGAGGGVGMSPYLFVYGSAGVVRGILHFALMTNPSEPAVHFTHMPMTNEDEVRERLEYGERELAGLAERTQIARILDGSINIASGLAILPIYLGPNDFSEPQLLDWFVLIAAGISVVTGVVTLLTTSDAERKWSAYSELRDRLEASESARSDDSEDAQSAAADGLELEPVVGASPSGAGWVGGSLRF